MSVPLLPDIVRAPPSPAFLAESDSLRRLPRAPRRRRPAAFEAAFEDRALVYDCFRHADGRRVVLVGPPPLNLAPQMLAATFRALPSGRPLASAFHPSLSTLVVELFDVEGEAVEMTMAGRAFVLPIGPNLSDRLAGRRAMVTMNKDNDLAWIAAWARWHHALHGVDAVIVFDNGSTRYGPEALEAALAAVPGLRTICVVSWPWRYGRKDPAVLDHPHYPHFLQVSSLNVALRRLAARSQGLLNCDIDELVGTDEGAGVFERLAQSPKGLVTLKGRWIEAIATGPEVGGVPHTRFRQTHRFPPLSVCANKWALDPGRDWVAPLAVKPSVHRIYDVPKRLGRSAPQMAFWHFKAISTNWKEARTRPGPAGSLLLRRAPGLDAQIARFQTEI